MKKNKLQAVHQITVPTPFQVGPVHVYVIKGEALTMIDAGPKTEEARVLLTTKMKELGFQFQDIEQIILTHHHPDHIGLADQFPHAEIKAHHRNEPWISHDHMFFSKVKDYFYEFYRLHGVPQHFIDMIKKEHLAYIKLCPQFELSQFLNEGDQIEGLSGWKVIETPGHAQTHISLLREEDGLFIGGDHILADISSNAIIEAPYGNEERPKTLLQYRNALRRCKELPIQQVLPGHGRAIGNPAGLIDKRLNEQDERANYLYELLKKDGEQTSFNLCQQLFPQVHQVQPALTLSEVIGHLDLLIANKDVDAYQESGHFYYVAGEKEYVNMNE
ncbi:MBL fold metallo-hydrolase [Salsuginibacillus kocurii]|uniref:MBL fold metallo-hydrolase n=1 Tax=Salsuginibacillus kocurii TaxID=427078 RepID=UPI00037C7C10|nr:MBL fold metallo-hydrolase [Salsuginibacillus kocurii]